MSFRENDEFCVINACFDHPYLISQETEEKGAMLTHYVAT